MLQGFRTASQTWLGKIVVALLFGTLIVAFAVWGINDIFRGSPSSAVATVGSTQITAEAVRNAYQNQLQRIIRQARRSITPEQARALGLDRQVLSQLVTEASLDEKARALGLHVSDATVRAAVMDDANFKGPNGQFDPGALQDALRSAGIAEGSFVREQRQVLLRLQLAEAVSADLPVPLAMREAVQRTTAERRTAELIVLPRSAAGEAEAPSDAQVQAYYDEHKAAFRAPEYRSGQALVLDVATLARNADVSEADARTRYEQEATRFGTPERRTIQQIVFPDEAAATDAAKRLREGGVGFDQLAGERGVDAASLTLGTFTRAELFDPAVAAAAFALGPDAVSEPVRGRFGTVLLRVTSITPASRKPFAEVEAEVRRQVAEQRARDGLEAAHDAVEDQRAGGKPLADIARERGLPLVAITDVDREGRDPQGQAVANLPDRDALLPALFRSDVGVDNEALRLREGGSLWYDVTKITPARDKPLAEVREAVARQWRDDETDRRLAAKARELAERLDKGEAAEAVAQALTLPVKPLADLARGQAKDDVPSEVVGRVFATPVGKAGSAAMGNARAVYKVTGATVPPFVTTTQAAERQETQLRLALADDLLAQYIAEVQKGVGVTVNEPAFRRAIGGEY